MQPIVRLAKWLEARPRTNNYLALSILILDLLLVYLDRQSGPFVPLTAFYVLLIYISARYVAPRFSYFIALQSAAGRTFAVSQAFPEAAYVFLALWQFASSVLVYTMLTHLFSRELHRLRSQGIAKGSPAAEAAPGRSGRRTALAAFAVTAIAAIVIASSDSSFLGRYRIDPVTDRIVENPLLSGVQSLDLLHTGKPLLLTFDDGPSSVEIDHDILDTLNRHHAHAMWFVNCKHMDPQLTPDAEGNRQTLRDIAAAGHVIGNHGYTHLALRQIKDSDYETMSHEIEDCSRMISSILKQRPRYFRAPFGQYTVATMEFVRRSYMQPVGWTSNTNDRSFLPHPEKYRAHLLDPHGFEDSVQAGDNILMHEIDLTARTLDALPRAFEDDGFIFVAPG